MSFRGDNEDLCCSDISALSLLKIDELMKCSDPPLGKALLVRLILLKACGGEIGLLEEGGTTNRNHPTGIMDYISSKVSKPLSFFYSSESEKSKEISGKDEEHATHEEKENQNESSTRENYVQLINVKNLGILARQVRAAEEEKMRKNWRFAQDQGKRTTSPERKLKRDPSAELLKEIFNPTPIERLPPYHFMRYH